MNIIENLIRNNNLHEGPRWIDRIINKVFVDDDYSSWLVILAIEGVSIR